MMPQVRIGGQTIPCSGILFDKDGTLLDFMQMWGSWAENLIASLDKDLTELGAEPIREQSELLGLIVDPARGIIGYDKIGPIAMGTEEEVTALLAWKLYAAGIPWNEATMQVRRHNKRAMQELAEQKNTVPLPGLPEFLQACHEVGMKLAVVTSDTTREAEKHLDWMGLRRYFSSIVGRDRVRKGKPDPEMALLAIEEIGLLPQQCIVIGDSNGDMVMGRRSGASYMIGIAEDGTGESYLLDADAIIRSYSELSVLSAQ